MNQREHLNEIINEASHLLSNQGPIRTFIHHNTLHAFEHLHFEEAIELGKKEFGGKGYFSDSVFRNLFRSNRIEKRDLEKAIKRRNPEASFKNKIRFHCLVQHIEFLSLPEVKWKVREEISEASPNYLLWKSCLKMVQNQTQHPSENSILLQPLFLEKSNASEPSPNMNSLSPLISALSAFLDDGVAVWRPNRSTQLSFFEWWKTTDHQISKSCFNQIKFLDPLDTLLFSFKEKAIQENDWNREIKRLFQILPGWAGMIIWKSKTTSIDLTQFLAALSMSETMGRETEEPIQEQRFSPLSLIENEMIAWSFFQLSLAMKWKPSDLQSLNPADYQSILEVFAELQSGSLSPIWQEAYENHYRDEILNAIHFKSELTSKKGLVFRPKAQVIFCMDEREEAIRRHFEEIDEGNETFGVAGFFGIAMYYRGLYDQKSKPLCPAPVTPQHEVVENASSLKRSIRRSPLIQEKLFQMKTMPLLSILLTPFAGIAAIYHLIGKILFPRAHHFLKNKVLERLDPLEPTRLSMPFTIPEQADRVEGTLKMIGLVQNFSKIIALLGHGSESLNNPHLGAYDCGACGGNHGGPNARIFAMMANHPEVRKHLQERGIPIPLDTWFVGGEHNTCSEKIYFYDADLIPAGLRSSFETVTAHLDLAREKSAIERCRRLKSAPNQTIHKNIHSKRAHQIALKHIESRALDFSQTRPELGHATNAIAIVGRRELTKNLFLDRRAFLISYDARIDPEGLILEKILMAAVPVGAGISLEYYFSTVDIKKYGCDSKLAQNVTGLIGVMEGSQSDLRTGLPQQMTEIHEPMRLQMAVEATPEVLGAIYGRQPVLQNLIGNQWTHLISIHPGTSEILLFNAKKGCFEPWLEKGPEKGPEKGSERKSPLKKVSSSLDWIQDQFEALNPAIIHD